ncbi:MAG: vitamin K epoxide reductase family protein [Chloroflexi bacterium]|nr:vitamin K epoxide reductase family protein [Chloroflexota bacterium]
MDKKLYWISAGLAIIGILVSVYMTVYKLTSNNSMCLGSGDCSTVNASPYSEVYGVPVAFVGVLGYSAILGLLLLQTRGGKFFEQNSIMAVFGLAITGFAFTLYLVYLEIYVIKALCPFCITSQITMTILFLITIIRLVRQPVN